MFVLLLLADAAATERHEQTPDGEQPYAPPGFPRPRSRLTMEVKALSLPSKEGWLRAGCLGASAPQVHSQQCRPKKTRTCRITFLLPTLPPLRFTSEGKGGFWRLTENKHQADLRSPPRDPHPQQKQTRRPRCPDLLRASEEAQLHSPQVLRSKPKSLILVRLL